ncbi:MAG: TrkH family potassium uptake protein [Bacteroidales bacterium]|jgi:trk system potassium uptake protein TrkH|nr:TrkH family potassium uptake protein [Bacteroidales bacterium]
MVNFRIIARVFSLVLIIEGLFMLLSAAVSFLYKEPASILFSGIITLVTGVLVFTPLRNVEKLSGNKEGYIIVTGIWLILSLFGTLPYLLSGSISNFGDAFFESMSGFTTTGATILTDIETKPHGILFWRSLTQWVGGAVFIIISMSALQVVKTINIQLTITDFTGQTTDKIHPKIKETGKRLITIYWVLTLAEAIMLTIGGMNIFDAICHSFSTMSTGGFSTYNTGIAAIGSPYFMVILTVFMFLAGTNMTIVYFGLKRNFKKITGNSEFIFYTLTCLVFIVIVSFYLWATSVYPPGKALLEGSFHVVSVITTTGFYYTDFSHWSSFLIMIMFILMFTGGMSGSASSSLKIIRLLLITKNARHEMRRMIHPNAFIPVRLDHKIIPPGIIINLLVFITLYFLVICFSSLIISLMGYDIITSFSTSASLLGNIGPALGSFGPFTNYAAIPVAGKWFFSFLMMLGRLELLSFLVLLTGNFYRR